jgi:nucleoside diphosphate kinase
MMNQDKLKCKNERFFVTQEMENLGFTINETKCVLIPTQRLELLGTRYLSKENTEMFCNLCGFLHENTHLLDQILSNNHLVVSNREQISNCLA